MCVLDYDSIINLCCRRRAAVLPPPLQEPPPLDMVEHFELVGQAEDFLQEPPPLLEHFELMTFAEEGWRQMMMRFHRLFFKRRCFAFLGMHLRLYSQLHIPREALLRIAHSALQGPD